MSTLFTFIRVCLLTLLVFSPVMVQAADDQTSEQSSEAPAKINAAVELPKMQKVLDKIKQQVSGETNDSKLNALNDLALSFPAMPTP